MRKLWQVIFLCSALQATEYIVSSLDDSGSGTLRSAMLIAVDDDVITFNASLSGTISLASSLPTITAENLLIFGPDSLAVAIDGSGQYQIFNIAADLADIRNLQLNNGANASFGGAVYVAETLGAMLNNVSVQSCSNTTCQSPIYIDDGAFINCVNPEFISAVEPDMYLVDAVAVFQSSNLSASSTIHIDGSGVVETKGIGSFNLFGVSNPTDLLIYNQSGMCTFSGTTSLVVLTHGTMSGNFSAEYIANIGTLQPGDNGVGSIVSSGDFIQTPDGALQIKIGADGTNDSLDLNGNFYPRGTLTILPQSGSYTEGTRYTFLTTTGQINTAFDSITCPIEDFPFIIVYHSNFVEIVITDNWLIN